MNPLDTKKTKKNLVSHESQDSACKSNPPARKGVPWETSYPQGKSTQESTKSELQTTENTLLAHCTWCSWSHLQCYEHTAQRLTLPFGWGWRWGGINPTHWAIQTHFPVKVTHSQRCSLLHWLHLSLQSLAWMLRCRAGASWKKLRWNQIAKPSRGVWGGGHGGGILFLLHGQQHTRTHMQALIQNSTIASLQASRKMWLQSDEQPTRCFWCTRAERHRRWSDGIRRMWEGQERGGFKKRRVSGAFFMRWHL